MNIVHYSQNREECPLLPGHNIPLLQGNPEEVVQTIQKQYSNAHIFILDLDDEEEVVPEFNVLPEISDEDDEHTTTIDASPQIYKYGGIRVLKLLRLKSYLQHCIVYSRRTREEFLLEDPRNSILGSTGVTFVQLGDELPKIEYERLHRQLANKDLRAYFVAEAYDIDNTNSFANSWGVWKLWEVQRAVEHITSQKTEEIERSFGNAYVEMNTYTGLLARYLRGNPYEDINKSLNEKMLLYGELLKQEAEVSKQHQAETEAIETLYKSLAIWSEQKEVQTPILEAIRQTIKALEESVQRSGDILAKCQAIKLEKNSISARKYSMNMRLSKELSRTSDNTFVEMRRRLNSRKPTIVFVDDLAHEGWAQILQRIIYNTPDSPEFHIIAPEGDIDHKLLSKQIQDKVREVEADLLILDLRLKGEYGLASTLENASGMQVLSELSDQLACPILIASTAEKMINYRELLSWGATASWTKQSLNERNDIEYTVSNYVSLIQIIDTLCFNKTIDFCYRDLLPAIQDLENQSIKTPFWWEERANWATMVGYEHLSPKRSEIIHILNGAYGHLRELIGSTIISGVAEELSESDNSLIVTAIFQGMEHLYNVKPLEEHFDDFVPMPRRLSELTPDISHLKVMQNIVMPRNNAIHAGRISRKDLERFIWSYFDFLEGRGYFTEEVDSQKLYTSTVTHIQENGYGTQHLIYLSNDEIRFEDGRTSITLLSGLIEEAGYYMADIYPGVQIRHTVRQDRNSKGLMSYYAQNIELV